MPPLRLVTPLPPLASGIAQYSADLLHGIGDGWPVVVHAEAGSSAAAVRQRVLTGRAARVFPPDARAIVQIGNSGYHRIAFERAARPGALLVLHDLVLHHGRLGELLRRRGGAEYRRLMATRYGVEGNRIADLVLRGRAPDDLSAYPLSEDFVERAALTVVHSQHGRERVRLLVPGATVMRVPMGIPLPQLIERGEARERLGLPTSAFVIASVTHVNPYKRLPVVLRALRRLVDRLPEALLVVAGSVAPGVDLARQVRLLGLERHVRLLGYVSDAEARLVVRAADACVNLRWPSAGETSASLLRMLGAGRPVLVTDDAMRPEFPADAVLPVPVDRFEDELLAELLLLLATDDELRARAGAAARAFVEREHSLAVMIEGYRAAIRAAWGIELPPVDAVPLDERLAIPTAPERARIAYTGLDARVADALGALRLAEHDGTIRAAARAIRELRLDRLPATGDDR